MSSRWQPLPARSEIAQVRFRAAEFRMAEATLTLADETRMQLRIECERLARRLGL